MGRVSPLFSVCAIILLAGCATAKLDASPADHYDRINANVSDISQITDPSFVTRLLLTREAATFIRTPYASPPRAPATFDCSSYVSYVYEQFGYSLPKSTGEYGEVGTRIDWEDAQPGDILVFAREKGGSAIDHVAMLWKKSDSGELAGSWIIHAASVNTGRSMQRGHPDTGTGVVITQLGLRGDGIIENEYFYQRFMQQCRRVLEK